MRAKAVAERAVMDSSLAATVFAPSVVYAPGDPYLRLLGRMSLLPVMAIPGPGPTAFQPIWAEDVADCVMAALPGGRRAQEAVGARWELAGPQTLTHREMVQTVLHATGRRRPILPIPLSAVRRTLKGLELVAGPTAFATWDEVELLEIPMVAERGSADAEWLGVLPRRMADVLASCA
jgi:NADH dehydrogenase